MIGKSILAASVAVELRCGLRRKTREAARYLYGIWLGRNGGRETSGALMLILWPLMLL